jgi:hypothetical protein
VYDGFGLDEKRNFCYIFVINEETVLFWRFWWNFFFIHLTYLVHFFLWLYGAVLVVVVILIHFLMVVVGGMKRRLGLA